MALPQHQRLRERRAFKAIYERGRRLSTPHFLLRFQAEGPSELPSRFGVVVSTKVHKRSVRRNRIRRQIHAVLIALGDRLQPGYRCVITVRAAALDCDYGQILQELEQLLLKANILHGDH